MKIAMISRATLYSSPGGDTIQIQKTASELKKLGTHVDIFLSDQTIPYDEYDLLHFFNLIRPADILRHTKNSIPYVISTIYVDYSEYERKQTKGIRRVIANLVSADFLEYIKVVARMILGREKIQDIRYILLGHRNSVRRVLKNTVAILPNSFSEQLRVEKKYKIKRPSFVVYNGIEPKKFQSIEANKKYENAVICVGRIEGRKCQLQLVKAMKSLPYHLYIIGKAAINDLQYASLCKKEAPPNVHFIEHLPQEELFSIMKGAKVHVLASYFETCGLVSLEAGYADCAIVISDKGDQKEYFQDDATYCEPNSIKSIQNAIEEAFQKGPSKALKKRIEQVYTWENAAKKSLEVYKKILNKTILVEHND